MNLSEKRIFLIACLGVVLTLGFIVFVTSKFPAEKAGNFNPTGGSTYVLKASISRTQTTIPLSSFTEPGSSIPYTMTYLNSDIEYATLAPNNPTGSEFISFTGITQNTDGSATLTGVTRGLARTPGNTGCVASTTLAHSFPGQTSLILSNSPCFYAEYAVKRNDQSISGVWTYDQYPVASTTLGNATTSRQFISLGQAQGLANQGAATSTESVAGIVRLATALQAASSTDLGVDIPLVLQAKYATDTPTLSTASASRAVISDLTGYIKQGWINLSEAFTWAGAAIFNSTATFNGAVTHNATTTNATTTISSGAHVFNNNTTNSFTSGETISAAGTPIPVMVATSSGRVFRVDADTASTTNFIGFAINNSTVAGTSYVQTEGVVSNFSGLTPGARYYVSDTIGVLGAANTIGTNEVYVGYALSATQLMIDTGPTASWQYIGTSCAPVPNFARFAVVSVSGNNGSRTITAEFTLSRNGKTSGSASINGDGITAVSVSASWSGSTISYGGNGTSISCFLYR